MKVTITVRSSRMAASLPPGARGAGAWVDGDGAIEGVANGPVDGGVIANEAGVAADGSVDGAALWSGGMAAPSHLSSGTPADGAAVADMAAEMAVAGTADALASAADVAADGAAPRSGTAAAGTTPPTDVAAAAAPTPSPASAASHIPEAPLVVLLAGNPATAAAILACLNTVDAARLQRLNPALDTAVAEVPWTDATTPVVDIVRWRAALPAAVVCGVRLIGDPFAAPVPVPFDGHLVDTATGRPTGEQHNSRPYDVVGVVCRTQRSVGGGASM